MKLVYGTTNKAKLSMMQNILKSLNIQVIGVSEKINDIPEIDETGNNPLENAAIKAKAYYDLLREPVFSCDSGLFIDELSADEQPGVHVRHIGGRVLGDEEMITYYSSIAKRNGGYCTAQYLNAICLIIDEDKVVSHMGADISGEKFYLSAKALPNYDPGFPLDAISVHIKSGQYYNDMEETGWEDEYDGFRDFFQKVIDKYGKILLH